MKSEHKIHMNFYLLPYGFQWKCLRRDFLVVVVFEFLCFDQMLSAELLTQAWLYRILCPNFFSCGSQLPLLAIGHNLG